jgi:antitoxin component YwqK of YwqJK toxin-antitoxin module
MRIREIVIACLPLAGCHATPDVVVTERYADGRIAEVRGYTHGDKDGLHLGWWPNGMPKFECRFDRGLAVGTCREWYADGRPASVHRFERGVESGLQQGWSANGAPQFSYEMRNGRRYGLLGTLNCKTGVRTAGAL